MSLHDKKGFLTILAALLICGVTSVSIGFADTLTSDFNINISGNPVASEGQVTFTLNPDGTIAASLVDYTSNIVGFGFDSVVINSPLPESNFSPAAPDNPYGWNDFFGTHNSGFLASSTFGTSETWTIGNPGDFTSVLGALGGGQATHPFFLYDNKAGFEWAGDIPSTSSVPEPSTFILLGAGLAGAGLLRRRMSK